MYLKALFFDIDDTIFDFRKCSKIALKKTCQRLGTPYSERLFEYYRKLDDELWLQQKQGKMRVAEVIQKRAHDMAIAMGRAFDGKDFAAVFSEELGETTELVEGIKKVLKEVTDKGYMIFCASNGIKTIQVNRLKKSGLLYYFKDINELTEFCLMISLGNGLKDSRIQRLFVYGSLLMLKAGMQSEACFMY